MALLPVVAGDEASLRSVSAAAVAGDIVAIPGGTYSLTANWQVNAGVTVEPSRAVAGAAGPVIVEHSDARHGLIVSNAGATVDRLIVRDIVLRGNGGLAAGGTTLDGISFVGSSGKKLTNVLLERVGLAGWRNGVSLAAADAGASAGVNLEIVGAAITQCRVRGITAANCSGLTIRKAEVNNCGANGIFANNCLGFALRDSAVETCNTAHGNTLEGDAQVLIKLCHGFTVDVLDVEDMPTTAGATKIALAISNCLTGRVDMLQVNLTSAHDPLADTIGIRLSQRSRGVVVGPMLTQYVKTWIARDESSVFPEHNRNLIYQSNPSTLAMEAYLS